MFLTFEKWVKIYEPQVIMAHVWYINANWNLRLHFFSGNPIPAVGSSDALATLMELGFPRETCIEALTANLRYKTTYF